MAAPASHASHGSGQLFSWRRNELGSWGVALLGFLAASAATLYFNHSMSGEMRMPGGWNMGMMWMPMGGVLTSVGIFSLMWLAMMVAMMLPSAMPMLLLHRRAIRFRAQNVAAVDGAARANTSRMVNTSTLAVVVGYFFVWTLFGVIAYGIGSLLARGAMHWDAFSRSLPLAGGVALCVAGIYQITPWKSACLTHCRDPLTVVANHLHTGRFGGLKFGLHHGAFCAACCWALMLIQLVLGVMSLRVMVAVALVIALEKLLPRGVWVARVTGAAAISAGLVIAARAV